MTEPVFLVQGSSRRIMSMLFRPVNISVVDRRADRLDHYLTCAAGLVRPTAQQGLTAQSALDACSHIRTRV
jgi:hypothetical protein